MLLLLGACTNNELPDSGKETVSPITFKSLVKGSRALIEDEYSMINSWGAFKIWGWRTPEGGNAINVFQGERVYHNGTYWDYDNPRYWANQSTYNFYALYPDTITGADYTTDGKLNFGLLDMRQNNEFISDLSVDLLRAEARGLVGMNSSGPVYLNFTHMLTNVNIDLKMHQTNGEAGDVMEVTYILLSGMNCVGSMTDDVWNVSEPSYFWDRLDVPQRLSANALPCFSDVLMLPQIIEENQVMLYVLYSYQQSGGEQMTKMLETYLPAGEWKAGEKLVYTGTVQVDNSIVFDTPQVESWGAEQVGGTIIVQ